VKFEFLANSKPLTENRELAKKKKKKKKNPNFIFWVGVFLQQWMPKTSWACPRTLSLFPKRKNLDPQRTLSESPMAFLARYLYLYLYFYLCV